jgi:DNA-binding cell septation regulator SpoVG
MKLQIKDISAEIRLSNKPGAVKAYADIRIQTDGGRLQEKGYAVIQKDGGAPFIGFPSRPGNTPGKFFPIVDAEGDIRSAIIDAIMATYRKSQTQ